MVSRDTGLVLPPCYHYNKTGEWLTLHMDTEDRGPRTKAQNNIYRLNSAETHVQLRKTDQNTRRGRRQQGRAQPEPSLLQAGHRGPAALGGRGEARQSPLLLPAAARAQSRSGGTCHRRQHPGQLALLVAPHTGTVGRGAALAQTRVSQFSADSENIDKIEGGSPTGSQPSRSSTASVCSPQPARPPPALEKSPSPTQQLTGRPWSFPAALKTLSHCSRAVPATPPAASKS